jgi:methionyl-tRNA formyltransferase
MAHRLLFCGTPEFAVPSLEALAKTSQIVHVLSQPDRPAGRGQKLQASPVKKKALELGLPVTTPENINEVPNIEFLRTLQLDAIVVVAYGQILKQPFLDLCPQKCVNLHGSCLPRWRGAAPIQRALMAGDRESGVSLQVIVKKLDAGPVIGERRIPLDRDINAIELHQRLQTLGVELFEKEFISFLNGKQTPIVQDEAHVTYAEKIQKSEARIDWSWPAEKIHNLVRGLALGPSAVSRFLDQDYKIHKTRVVGADMEKSHRAPSKTKPGTVVSVASDHFTVACGEGVLEVWQLQPDSKKRLSAEEFLRGFSLPQGGVFES